MIGFSRACQIQMDFYHNFLVKGVLSRMNRLAMSNPTRADMADTRMSFMLPDSLEAALKQRAAAEERPMSFIIRRALARELGVTPEPEAVPDSGTPDLPFAP